MAWMPVDQFLPSHPKTARLARELGWTPRYACGFLLELWGWAINHQPDGYIERADRAALAQGVRMSREELARVTRALREVGWVDTAGSRSGRLHEWEEWGGKIVERRKADRDRQERNRRRRAENEGMSRVTSNGQSLADQAAEIASRLGSGATDVTRDVRVTSERRQDKTRQDKNPPPPTTLAHAQDHEARADEILEGATGTWRAVLELLRGRAKEDQHLMQFVTWYAGTRLEERGSTYFVVAPNQYARDYLTTRFMGDLRASIGVLTDQLAPDVRVVLESEIPAAEAQA